MADGKDINLYILPESFANISSFSKVEKRKKNMLCQIMFKMLQVKGKLAPSQVFLEIGKLKYDSAVVTSKVSEMNTLHYVMQIKKRAQLTMIICDKESCLKQFCAITNIYNPTL